MKHTVLPILGIALLLMMPPRPCHGQPAQLELDHITATQGLSNFSVISITQDKTGFLWFGTEDGLNRYDGYSFHVYRHDGDDTSSLAHSRIQSLTVDREGNLWVGTSRGLDRYDNGVDGFIHVHRVYQGASWLAKTAVNAVIEDHRGVLWIGTSSGLGLLDPAGGICRKLDRENSNPFLPPSTSVTSLQETDDGVLWLGTSHGLYMMDSSRTHITYIHTLIPPTSKPSSIAALAKTADQNLWVGAVEGLYLLDRRIKSLTAYVGPVREGTRFPRDMVNSLFVDSRGVLWVGTIQSGVFALAPSGTDFFQYLNDPGNPRSLDRNRINTIFEDRAGVLWISTYRGALNRFDRRREVFFHVRSPRSVYGVLLDSHGVLWLGGDEDGLWQMADGVNTQARPLQSSPFKRGENVLALAEDENSNIWIGTDQGLLQYDRRRNLFSKTTIPFNAPVKTLLVDADGNLWIGTQGSGLAWYDPVKKIHKWYRHDQANHRSISSDHIWSIRNDSSGMIWLATFGGGLNMLDPTTETFTRFANDSLGSDGAYSVWVDNRSNVWVGTFGGGLSMLDRSSGLFTRNTVKQGLPDNFVKCVIGDEQGNIWISTDKGIARLDPRTGAIRSYSSRDVLHGDVFLSGSCFRCSNGRLIFGGEEGTTIFHPDSIRFNTAAPPIILTAFEIFNQPFSNERSVLRIGDVNLTHDQNSVSFQYVAFDYANPGGITYTYKLEGVDRDWVDANDRRYAAYAHLQHGTYTFRVLATNDDGITNLDGASLRLTIAPPFWQTWWFRVLFVAVLAVLLYSIYRFRVRRVLLIEGLRRGIAQDLHDDVGTNLSAIVLSSQMMQRKFSLPKAAQTELQEVREVASRTQDLMRDIVWMLNPENDSLNVFLEKMKQEASRLLKEIPYQFHVSGVQSESTMDLVVKRNIFLIYKEALNNIIRHSDATRVEISVARDDSILSLEIMDNGKGFDPQAETGGNGLQNMRTRSDHIAGTIDINGAPGSGTTIRLKMKIARSSN
ncbi:MAG TPA: two-component regulator propeller domain-containing protein [Bacteroidota bacterium]